MVSPKASLTFILVKYLSLHYWFHYPLLIA